MKWLRPDILILGGVVAVVAYLGMTPVAMLLYGSLQTSFMVGDGAFSLANYIEAYSDREFYSLFFNSLLYASGVSLATMSIGTLLAWVCERTNTPGRRLFALLAVATYVIPGVLLTISWILLLSPRIGLFNALLMQIFGLSDPPLTIYSYWGMIMGVSMIFVYLTLPVPIYGTLWILLVAYVTLYMPYGIRIISATMVQIHKELEEASTASGASWFQTFFRIVLPLLLPGFVSGWIYVAIISLRELSASIFLVGQGTEVLSTVVFSLWDAGDITAVAALGVLMTLFLMAVAIVVRRWQRALGIVE